MKSILYVSKANLAPLDSKQEIHRIVTAARERNSVNAVTGMLVFTGDHFAQMLEGPAESVDLIMASIRIDPRHQLLSEHVRPVAQRSFGAWSLGYDGGSTYVDRLVRSVFATDSHGGLEEAQAELQELMLLLAHQSISAERAQN